VVIEKTEALEQVKSSCFGEFATGATVGSKEPWKKDRVEISLIEGASEPSVCRKQWQTKVYRHAVQRSAPANTLTRERLYQYISRYQAVLQKVDHLIGLCTPFAIAAQTSCPPEQQASLSLPNAESRGGGPPRNLEVLRYRRSRHITPNSPAIPLHLENITFTRDVLFQTDAGREPRHQHHHRRPGSRPVDRIAMLRYHHPAPPAPAPPVQQQGQLPTR